MSRSSDHHEGLPLGYRIVYRVKSVGLNIFGPATLGEDDDPRARLRHERAAKIAAAQPPAKSREISTEGGPE